MSEAQTSEARREGWRLYKQAQRARQAKRPISRFPAKFFELAEYFGTAREESQELSVRMSSATLAQQMKWQWYEFKKALHAQGLRQDLQETMEKILLKVRGEVLTFSWRDLAPVIQEFNALEVPSLTATSHAAGAQGFPQEPVDEAEELMRKMFGKGGDGE